ncbi:MAG: DUF1192 domain-containing protein [Halopseudomonas aestusnigri]
MNLDDLEPRKAKAKVKDLEPMGLEELRDYIQELELEIDRARAEINRKEKHRQGLDGVFKT